MKKDKFTVRDLVNAGLFSVLVLAAVWASGMIGFFPITMPIVPFVCTFVAGPVFMLYSTRIKRFGMLLIMGIIFGAAFSASGHGIYVFPGIVIVTLIGEYILKMGDYNSIKHARWAYTVFALFAGANLLPLYISRESYYKALVESGYGVEYADKLMTYLPTWSFVPVVLFGCLGAYLGASLGIKILNKHFKSAGMV